MAERSPHSLLDHPLSRAFRLLFDDPKVGAPTILDRVDLAKSFARALFTTQANGEGTAGTPAEWRSRAEEARTAYSLLDAVLGGQRKVFIERWHSDVGGHKQARDGHETSFAARPSPRPPSCGMVEAPDVARAAQPGQFVMVRLREGGERIPMALASAFR
jgi:hypothetical protein